MNSTPAAAPPRRIQSVIFSGFEIQAQFTSPYPFDDLIPAGQVASGSGTASNGNCNSGKRALGNAQARIGKELEVTPISKARKGNSKGKQAEIIDESEVFPIQSTKSIPLSTPSGITPIPPSTSIAASRISPHPIKSSPSTSLPEPKIRTRRMSKTHAASPLLASTLLHPPIHPPPTTASPSRSIPIAESLASAPGAIPVVEIPVKTRRGITRAVRVEDGTNSIEPSKESKARRESNGYIDTLPIPSALPTSSPQSSTLAELDDKPSPPSKRGGGKSLLPPMLMPKSNGTSATNGSTVVTSKLFVCDYCFKYMLQGAALVDHMVSVLLDLLHGFA